MKEHQGVMGPDEYHASTDNNVYTNVVAGLSIYLAEFAHCVGGCPQVPPSWPQVTKTLQCPTALSQVAASLALEYSKELDLHPQYRGYTPGTVIKQADTVLVRQTILVTLCSGWLSPHVSDGAIYQEQRFDHIRGSYRPGSLK